MIDLRLLVMVRGGSERQDIGRKLFLELSKHLCYSVNFHKSD